MMPERKQETWWVLLAQSGDRAALNELLRAVQEPLFRYILQLVGEHALAEDVLQEVFITVYRKLHWLREPELFRPWAYRISTREAFRRLKRERRWEEQVRDEAVLANLPAPDEPEGLSSADSEAQAWILARASPASRAVLALHYLQGLSLEEVAAVLGLPVGTVKSRLAYGLGLLRKQAAGPHGPTGEPPSRPPG